MRPSAPCLSTDRALKCLICVWNFYAFLIYFHAPMNHTHIETNTYVLCYQNEDIIDFLCFYKKLIVNLTPALLFYLFTYYNFWIVRIKNTL